MVAYLFDSIDRGDMDEALRLLQRFLLTVPYCDHTDYEEHYQQMLYVIFSLLGFYVDVEVRTPQGRVDMVLRTTSALYVMEPETESKRGGGYEPDRFEKLSRTFCPLRTACGESRHQL